MKGRMRTRKKTEVWQRPTSPGEILLEEFMAPLALTQMELAERMRVPRRRINEIIRGRRELTPDTAHRLAAVFGIEPEFWLNLQMHYDLWRVYQEKCRDYATIRPLRRRAANHAV